MASQSGRPIGFAITGRIPTVLLLGDSAAAAQIRTDGISANDVMRSFMTGRLFQPASTQMNSVFKPWMISPTDPNGTSSLETTACVGSPVTGGQRNPANRPPIEMSSSWHNVTLGDDSPHLPSPWQEISRNMRKAEEKLRNLYALISSGSGGLDFDSLVQIASQAIDSGFGKRDLLLTHRHNSTLLPTEILCRYDFLTGAMWYLLGIAKIKSFSETHTANMDVAAIWTASSGYFNLSAQSLEKLRDWKNAVTLYAESAKLIEMANRRKEDRGESLASAYSTDISNQADLLIKGYHHAYWISRHRMRDYSAALRLAIINVVAFAENGWNPQTFQEIAQYPDRKFYEPPGTSHSSYPGERHPHMALYHFLSLAKNDLIRNADDPVHMGSEDRMLIEQADALLAKLHILHA